MTGLLSEYLTRDQLAEELRVTPRTIIRWQSTADGLPHVQIGGRVLYRVASVKAWLESKERKPNQRRSAA